LHQHPPALKQLLANSHLANRLQSQFRVPVGRLLDCVFGSGVAPGVPAFNTTWDSESAQGAGGAGGAAGAAGAAVKGGSGSVGGDGGWGLCQEGLRQLEYWPWVNPYCRPITHSE
jgi:hypothetical protein